MPQTTLDNLRVFLTFSLICLSIALFDNMGFFNGFKGFFQKATGPIQYGLYKQSLKLKDQFDFIFLAKKAYEENQSLRLKNGELLSENSLLKKKLEEQETLLSQQKTLDPGKFNLVPAKIIGLSRYLYLNKGSDDGLRANQAVLVKDNLIGVLGEVDPKRSKVIVTSDPDFKVAAYVSDRDGRARGVLTGQFGSEILLDKMLHQEPIKTGDLVYSEGSEGNIPRGLILGVVSEVKNLDNQIFKQAKVKPVFNIFDLDIVFVVTN